MSSDTHPSPAASTGVAPPHGAVDVGPISDFEHAVPRVFVIGEREIGVVRWGDTFFAVRNQCPDQGGPLCAGAVRQALSADPTQDHVDLTVEDGPPIIACPWHHYEFDLETGRELRGGRRAVTYRIEVAGGRVYLNPGRAAG